jgi:hypothetical protein
MEQPPSEKNFRSSLITQIEVSARSGIFGLNAAPHSLIFKPAPAEISPRFRTARHPFNYSRNPMGQGPTFFYSLVSEAKRF